MSPEERHALQQALAVDPTDIVEGRDRRRCIERALERLPQPDRQVVSLRFGFSGAPLTLREVGRLLRVTPERVRQIQARAIRRLRRGATSTGIRDYAPGRGEG